VEGVVNWTLPGHVPAQIVPATVAAKEQPEKQICKKTVRIGTLADFQRTCMTPTEWARQSDEMKQPWEDVQGKKGSSGENMCSYGSTCETSAFQASHHYAVGNRRQRRRSRSGEDSQIEGFALAEPDHVLRVVGELVASVRVSEDRQRPPIERQPPCDFSELLSRHSQLTASPRMRADGTQVIMTFGNSEPLMCSMAERLRLLDLFRIEIDVRVEVADHAPNLRLSL
jgi:hypothetical protein